MSPEQKPNFQRDLEPVLSKRGKYIAEYEDFLVPSLHKAAANPYHPIDNPKGIINMGTATNQLMEEELSARLMQKDLVSFNADNQHYFDFSGISQLKEAAANFLTRHLQPVQPIIPQNIMVLNGVSSCLDAFSHVLCDPNDVIISPCPVYGRVFTDMQDASRAVVEPLHMKESEDENGDNFTLDADELENKIVSLRKAGKRVRAFILLNPNNPLGDVYSVQLLEKLLHVCAKHEVHFISDEIYAFSIIDENTKFHSILSLDVPDPSRTHFVWGFSKDFGLAAMRTAILYSLSQEVVQALAPLSVYKCVSRVAQEATAAIINDIAWCDEFFLPTNAQRIRKAYARAAERALSMGARVRRAQGGLFLWIGIHSFLPDNTEKEELKLHEEFLSAGLYIVPGTKMYCAYPGWFRLVITVRTNVLEEGLNRLEKVLKSRQKRVPMPNKL